MLETPHVGSEVIVYLSPDNDTVGESFEPNVAADQEAGTLTGTGVHPGSL